MTSRHLLRTAMYAFLLQPALTLAIEDAPEMLEASSIQMGTLAQPIAKPKPEYPRDLLVKRKEGYVELSYVISPEGTVSNVVVNDIIGPKILGAEAKRAVEKWTFTPATWQGQPVQQCSNQVAISFVLSPKQSGGSPKHVRQYKEINVLIDQGNHSAAADALDKIFDDELNQYEHGFFNIQRARLAHAQNLPNTEHYYLQRAAVGEKILGRAVSREILTKLFVAEVNSGNFAEAMETYEQLRKHSAQIDDWQLYESRYAQIVATRDGADILVTQGQIHDAGESEDSFWRHSLLRRSVEFAEIQGKLDKFEFRCDRKYFTDKVATDRNWAVPESWGQCEVFVYGEPSTSFKLVEPPPTQPAAGESDSNS